MFKQAIIVALAMIGAQAIKVDTSVHDFGYKGPIKGGNVSKGSATKGSWIDDVNE